MCKGHAGGFFLLAAPVAAGPLEDAVAAFGRGDYATVDIQFSDHVTGDKNALEHCSNTAYHSSI